MNLILGIHVDNFPDRNLFKVLLQHVPATKQSALLSVQHHENAFLSLLGELLVRYQLSRYLKRSNKDLFFQYNEYGKPSLLNGDTLHFNISHAVNKVLVAVTENPVGIDIEEEKIRGMDIARQYFHPNEYFDLLQQSEETRCRYFTALWTLKESFIKFQGMGLTIPLNSFYIRINESATIFFQSDLYPEQIEFRQLMIPGNFQAAICTLKGSGAAKIQWLTADDFIRQVTNELDYF